MKVNVLNTFEDPEVTDEQAPQHCRRVQTVPGMMETYFKTRRTEGEESLEKPLLCEGETQQTYFVRVVIPTTISAVIEVQAGSLIEAKQKVFEQEGHSYNSLDCAEWDVDDWNWSLNSEEEVQEYIDHYKAHGEVVAYTEKAYEAMIKSSEEENDAYFEKLMQELFPGESIQTPPSED